MFEFHKYVHESNPGKLNWGKAILKDNHEKWRSELQESEIQRIEEITYETLVHFGYPVTCATASSPISQWEKARGYMRDLYALLFIGNRVFEENRLQRILLEIRKRLTW